jgi:murein DD-endopeptidase MepM/ murein hydrolase activator NlpD
MSYDPLKDDSLLKADPLFPTDSQQEKTAQGEEAQDAVANFEKFWEQVTRAGLVEPALRVGTLVLSLIFVLIIVWVLRAFYLDQALETLSENTQGVLAAPLATEEVDDQVAYIPDLISAEGSSTVGISRNAWMHTNIPTRARVDLITYVVEEGDSVFGIAEKFSLQPATILWSNTNSLQDNPHRLQVGQELNIMPIDGTLHKWSQGENLQKVAEYYGVDATDILEWPGNNFNIYEVTVDNVSIEPGTMLIVPGGSRGLIDYGPPRIPREDPAIARTYGPGHCGSLTEGIVGDGLFVWPTTQRYLSGYDYNPAANHPAIDIAGDTGDPVFAVDDGVVVYAGWSYSGYGNLIVIDHGNEWQSLYAHLNDYYVSCGESVYSGAVIGTIGNTGNSAGDHLHFELMYITQKVNPWNFLP